MLYFNCTHLFEFECIIDLLGWAEFVQGVYIQKQYPKYFY